MAYYLKIVGDTPLGTYDKHIVIMSLVKGVSTKLFYGKDKKNDAGLVEV